MSNRIITILLFTITVQGFSQGIQDSIYILPPVTVNSEKIFSKDNAGMKETKLDTLILAEKINLSLSDLLSENTPVFIKNHGRGALSTASFRGTAPSHTKVSWNGVPLSSPMAGMVDFSLIPVYIIDEVSLNYGSSSISDGSGGLGGSVNINNSVDWNDKFSLKYLQSVGSYSTFDEYLKINASWEKFSVKTRLYHNYSKNDFTFINRGIGEIDEETGQIINPLDTNHNAEYCKYGLLQELYFRPNYKNLISVRYWGQFADRTIPRATSYEGPDNSNLNSQEDSDHKFVMDWSRITEKSKMKFIGAYSNKDVIYTLMNYISGVGLYPAIYSVSHNNSFIGKFKYTYDINEKYTLSAGLNNEWNSVNSLDTVVNSGYNKSRNEMSGFMSFSANPIERLNFKFILRQNLVDFEAIPIIPYLGCDFKLLKQHDLVFKANVARNYNIPSLHDLYWQPGGNPDLLPEEGVSYEGGLEYSFAKEEVQLVTELSAYRSDIKNWILWLPSFKGYWEPTNIEKVIAQGIELNAKLDFRVRLFRFSILGAYSYTSSRNFGDPLVWGDESYGKQLAYIPLHSGNLMFRASYKDFHFSYQHNSYSERFTTSTNDITQRDWLYPYFMNDIIIGWHKDFSKFDFSAEFKVYNLLDETYHSVLYRPMPGRNYVISLIFEI